MMHQRVAHLPYGFRCTFSYDRSGMRAEWEPEPPVIRNPRARRRFLKAYKAARLSFLTDVATALNGSVAVADIGEEGISVIKPGTKH